MTATRPSADARGDRAPLVRRALTTPGASAFELVDWSERPVQITEGDGSVTFACALAALGHADATIETPLPADIGVEATEDVFIAAWRLGLKSIAVCREGSKLHQPLTTDAD